MRNLQPAVDSAFQGTEDLGTSGGARQTDVEVAAEGALALLRLHHELVTIDLQLALVQVVQFELLQGL